MKKCKKCLQNKKEENFYFNKTHNAYFNVCKECYKNDTHNYKIKNKKRDKITKKIYRKNHLKEAVVHIKKWKKKYPEKQKAQEIISQMIKKGKIKRGECSICGKNKAEAHHPDYSKPRDIVWLCKLHHTKEHLRLKKLCFEDM